MPSPDDASLLRDSILGDALELEPALRPDFIAHACAGNPQLQAEIERLLTLAPDLGEGFLESPQPQTPQDPLVGQCIGRFRVEEKIGEGGAGTVYRARDTEIHRTVALKLMRPGGLSAAGDSQARFLRELRLLGSLSDENVVRLYDFGEHEGQLYLLMEFLPGVDLSRAISAGDLGGMAQRLDIGRQVIAGLEHIHRAGIIHRDLKPANIFLLPSGAVKLMDFGIASAQSTQLTTTGYTMGTPAYMSPEQIEGRPLTRQSDVHSLGVTLFELFSGRRAFEGTTMAAVFHSVLNSVANPAHLRASGTPEPVIAFVLRCLEKDPALRPVDLSTEYSRALGGVEPPSPPPHRTSRRTAFIAAGAVGFFAVGGLAWRFGALNGFRIPDVRSVAVLPFANGTGDPRYDYLASGLTEGLITALGYMDGLMVTARSAVLAYLNKTVDPREIGQRLGVQSMLTGTLERRGNAFQVVAEMASTRNAAHLWGVREVFREEELPGAHGLLAQQVAQAVGLRPKPIASQLLGNQTTQSAAYQSYLYGRYAMNQRTLSGYQRATQYFTEAVQADPAFAAAWAGLADSYSFQGGLRPPKEVFPKAKDAVERALNANPNLAEARASAGFIHLQYDWDWPAAEAAFRAALALNGNDTVARSRYARLLLALGRFQEAEQELLHVARLDPVSLTNGATLANCYYLSRRYEKAHAQIRKVLDLEPQFMVASDLMADILVELGRYREAILIYEKESEAQPDDAGALASLVRAALLAKDTPRATRAADKLTKLTASRPVNPTASAMVSVSLDRPHEAVEHLWKAYREKYWPLIFLKVSPIWDPLRDRADFQTLLRALNLS